MNALSLLMLTLLGLTIIDAAQAGSLTVGAAKVDISSTGYADGKPPARNYAHEYVYIRAIVLDNGETKAVLVGADLAGVRPEDMYQEAAATVARELGMPVANIIMSPSHTHSTYPVLENSEQVLAAIVRAVRLAAADMQPASVGFGEGEVFLNANRDVIDYETGRWTQDTNLDYPSDKTLAVMAFYDKRGAPIAGYLNYAMHPVNGFLSGFISSDFAGAASRHVEQAFGDSMITIFTQGASGDQNPLHLRTGSNVMAVASGTEVTGFELTRETVEGRLRGDVERRPNDPAADEALKRWMDAQGQVVGEEAIRVMTNMGRLSDNVRIGANQMILTCPGRDLVERVDRGYPGTYVDGDDVNIRVGFLGINEIGLAWTNAENYSLIGQQAMAEIPLAKTMVVTKSNGRPNSGYVPTDDAYGRNTFQVVRSRLKPGCAHAGIVKSVTDMAYDYIN
ncbi:MAG: neutral/alkaline non-lysosomal ceramidase N-terminal domain-containing protein [Gammaproteobacteria bacterium]|nr:neutral/alkaline non-lysosomal ceramidase N-terminal domain-containing protein [Gammaproteobacteria bacterium]